METLPSQWHKAASSTSAQGQALLQLACYLFILSELPVQVCHTEQKPVQLLA